jgi:hypothetical protein
VVGRRLPHVGDDEDAADDDAQADRGEHERGGAAVVPEGDERDGRRDGHPERPGVVERLAQAIVGVAQDALHEAAKSRPVIAACMGRTIRPTPADRRDAAHRPVVIAARTRTSTVPAAGGPESPQNAIRFTMNGANQISFAQDWRTARSPVAPDSF